MNYAPETFEDPDLGSDFQISEEKFAPTAFTRQYTVYSKGLVGKRLVSESDPRLELPNNSTLHTLSHFLDPQDDHALQELRIPLLQKESYQCYYNFVTDIPGSTASPFPIGDTVVYQASKARNEALQFFRDHRGLRRMVSETTLSRRSNILIVNDYSALHRIKVQGTMQGWRKSDIILRTILETIVQYPATRNHFIYLPLSGHMYSRAQYQRTFAKADTATTMGVSDPSFYLVCQLLGFVYGMEHPQDTTLPKSDQDLMRLRDKQLEKGGSSIPALQTLPSLSLFNRLSDKQLDLTNIVLTHGGRLIIYNLGQLKEFGKTPNFYNRFYQHLRLLSTVEMDNVIPDDEDALEEAAADNAPPVIPDRTQSNPEEALNHDEVVDEERTKDTGDDLASPSLAPLAGHVQDRTSASPVEVDHTDVDRVLPTATTRTIAPKSVTEKINEQTFTTLPFSQSFHGDLDLYIRSLDKTQQARALTLLERQRKVMIGGRTLEDHALSSSDTLVPAVSGTNAETHPDPSVTSSIIPNFDKLYLENNLHRDIARTLLSFTRFGFFVYSIKEDVSKNRMNAVRTYRVEMVHADGSRHVNSFYIPEVDADGNILSNGVTYRMSKQMIANPVCKVSPYRVNLSSNYNKSVVERIQTERGGFAPYLLKTINNLLKQNLIKVQFGRNRPDATVVPYEYSIIASRYDSLHIPDAKGYRFLFNYGLRFDGLSAPQISYLIKQEEKYGVFCGYAPNGNLLFWDMGDRIHALTTSGTHINTTPHFLSLLMGLYPSEAEKAVPYEYTMIKIMDQVYPLAFVLGFRKGLQWMIDRFKLDYRWVPFGQRLEMEPTDLRIRFADGSMVFSRYPLESSLIFAGLSWCNTASFKREEFDHPDVYYSILDLKLISTNRLKGITSFLDMFVDPTTEEVLRDLGEPTEIIDLILWCNSLLTYQSHHQASSVRHHRIRGYERMPAILYNEMSRRLATYQSERGRVRQFSINPEAVYRRIIGDQTCETLETLNPLHEVRTISRVSYAGLGGRSSRSFVVEDRRYPKDGVGVISENSPDSSKIGMIFSMSHNPNVVSLRGKLTPYEDGDKRSGGELFSTTANIFPGSAQDDSKRVNFATIQMSHHVPCKNSELNRIRTGTEATIASMVSSMFAVTAPADGTITAIDEKHNILHFTPKPVLLNIVGKMDLKMSASDIEAGAKNHSRTFVLVEKPPGAVHESFQVKSGKVATILAITPQTNPKTLPQSIQETFSGDLTRAKYLLEIGLSEPVIHVPDTYYEYGVRFSTLSGSQMRQDLTVNVKVGDTVRKGDVLIYNEGFFSPAGDPWDPAGANGVNWNHGVMANVALVEKTSNYEDASTVSQELADKLVMHPAHVRRITTTVDTIVEDLVAVDTRLSSTDSLCYLRDGTVSDMSDDDIDGSSFFFDALTRKAVKARYSGRVAAIEFLYSSDLAKMPEAMRKLIRTHETRKRKMISLAKESGSNLSVHSGHIPPGTKYQGVEFDDTTVMIEVTIEEAYPAGQADKICFMTAAKTTISNVFPHAAKGATSGRSVDAFFSATSFFKRMLMTPFLNGKANLVVEDAEKIFTGILFD